MEQNPTGEIPTRPLRTGRSLVRTGPNVFFDDVSRVEPVIAPDETSEESRSADA